MSQKLAKYGMEPYNTFKQTGYDQSEHSTVSPYDCKKEGNIRELQVRMDMVEHHEEILRDKIDNLVESQQKLSDAVIQLTSTLNTVKWFLGVMIIPIAIWAFQEVVHLI